MDLLLKNSDLLQKIFPNVHTYDRRFMNELIQGFHKTIP